MKNRLFLLLLSFLCRYTYLSAQCDWNPVCISYCSDIWDGAGNTKTCFDPAGTSFTNPAKLNYCYKKQKEQFVLTSHPTNPSASWIRKRIPQFNVCIPDNICNLSFNLGEVKKNNETEIISLLENNSSVYTDINRLTPCEDCGNNKYFTLSSHRDILNSNGTYKMTLTYQCCDKDGNITGTGTSSFYYMLEDATSEVDVDIAFTASQTIETLNGDPDIDGILLTDGSFPGPELGPASAGVRIATAGQILVEIETDVPSDVYLTEQKNYWLSSNHGIKKITNSVEPRSSTSGHSIQVLTINNLHQIEIQPLNGESTISIYDAYGRRLSTKRIDLSTHNIDADLPIGIYILSIEDKIGIQSQKVFISK